MVGYNDHQLEFLELADLLPQDLDNAVIWKQFQGVNDEKSVMGEALEGYLVRIDGSHIECILTLNPIDIRWTTRFHIACQRYYP